MILSDGLFVAASTCSGGRGQQAGWGSSPSTRAGGRAQPTEKAVNIGYSKRAPEVYPLESIDIDQNTVDKEILAHVISPDVIEVVDLKLEHSLMTFVLILIKTWFDRVVFELSYNQGDPVGLRVTYQDFSNNPGISKEGPDHKTHLVRHGSYYRKIFYWIMRRGSTHRTWVLASCA